MVASVARIAAANLWGKAADSYSWRLVTLGSIFMLGVAYIGWGLLTKENCIYWLPVVQAVSGVAWGGINIATFRMQFAFAPLEHRVSYVSFCSTMVGFVGFFSSMLGSTFVAFCIRNYCKCIIQPKNKGEMTGQIWREIAESGQRRCLRR